MSTGNSNQSPSSISQNQFSPFSNTGNYARGMDKSDSKNLLPELIARLHEEKPTHAELMASTTFSESGQPSPSLTSHSSAPNLRFQSSSSSGDAMLSAINYNENEMLADGSGFDMSVPTNLDLGDSLLQGGTSASMNTTSGTTFDLFGDSDGGMGDYNMDTQPDLQLSPHGYSDAAVGLQLTEQEHRQGGTDDVDIACNALVSLRAGGYQQQGTSMESGRVESQVPVPPTSGSGGTQDKPRGKGRPAKTGGLSSKAGVHCQVCGKLFNNSSALAKHKLTHSDERKYICPICSKAFKRQDHLNGHMMTHRSKKPFECKFEGCDKSYCDARSLRRHLENHHQQSVESAASNLPGAPFPSSESASGEHFRFDMQARASTSTAWHGEPQKSPGYLQQVSPISPAPGQAPSSPLDCPRPSWNQPSFLTLQSNPGQTFRSSPIQGNTSTRNSEPKPVQCNMCHRRFKNIPALNGHMRLHGGYFKKELQKEEKPAQPAPATSNPTSSANVFRAPASVSQATSSAGQFQMPAPPPMDVPHSPRLTTPHRQIPPPIALQSSNFNLQPEVQSPHHVTAPVQHFQSEVHSPHIPSSPMHSNAPVPLQNMLPQSPHLIQQEIQSPRQLTAPVNLQQEIHSPRQLHPPQQFSQQPEIQSPCQINAPQNPFHSELQSPRQPNAPHQFPPPMQSPHQSNPPIEVAPDVTSPRPAQQFVQEMQSPHHVNAAQTQFNFPQTTYQQDFLQQVPGPVQSGNLMPQQTNVNLATTTHNVGTSIDQTNSGTSSNIITEIIEQQLLNNQNQQLVQEVNEQLLMQHALETIQQGQMSEQQQGSLSNLSLQQQNFNSVDGANYGVGMISQQPLQSPGPHPHTPSHCQTPTHQQMGSQYGSHPPTPSHPLTPTANPQSHPCTPNQPLTPNQRVCHPPQGIQTMDNQMFKFPPHQPQPTEMTAQTAHVTFTKDLPVDLDGMFKPIKSIEGVNERKRRASADPDKYTQRKTQMTEKEAMNLLIGGGLMEKFLQPDPSIGLLNTDTARILSQKVSEVNSGTDSNQNMKSTPFSESTHTTQDNSASLDSLGKSHTLPSKTAGSLSRSSSDKQIGILSRSLSHSVTLKSDPRDDTGVFRNPSSQVRPKKKKHRPEPLKIPPHSSTYGYQSMIRSPRLPGMEHKGNTPPPYTPPPMLSPIRSGSGLFWSIHGGYKPKTPKSAPIFPRFSISRQSSSGSSISETIEEEPDLETEQEAPPETDVTPHVNVGSQFQATLPEYNSNFKDAYLGESKEDILWDPVLVEDITDEEVQWYLDFACCAAVPGNGLNKELALHLLQLRKGNIMDAILLLMNGEYEYPANHPLIDYKYQETDLWTSEQIELYHQALLKCDKDFFNIAKEVPEKTVKECVQFYYLWKKVCPDEYKRMRIMRRKREQDQLYNLRSQIPPQKIQDNGKDETTSEYSSPSPKPEEQCEGSSDPVYSCDYSHCQALFGSKEELAIHTRELHPGPSPSQHQHENRPSYSRQTPSPGPRTSSRPTTSKSTVPEDGYFPCKICGKVFPKVKSRSAHMKSHRQAESSRSVRYPTPDDNG